MAQINSNGEPFTQRLTVEAGMTTAYVEKNGNNAQKLVRLLFDADGDGEYNDYEAEVFNKTRVSVFYDKNKALTVTVRALNNV